MGCFRVAFYGSDSVQSYGQCHGLLCYVSGGIGWLLWLGSIGLIASVGRDPKGRNNSAVWASGVKSLNRVSDKDTIASSKFNLFSSMLEILCSN